jgi:hypothetical protein
MSERNSAHHPNFLRSPAGSSRRTFLRRTGLSTLGAGLVAASTGLPAHAATPTTGAGVDYTDRHTWDAWHEEFYRSGVDGQPDQPNDDSVPGGKSGNLGWGQSYLLAGLLRMYLAHRDTYYLDRMIENTDLVLSVRDSERGVTDYRGASLPAWRANHPYTVGSVALADAQGRPSLEVRVGRVYSSTTSVTVRAGSTPGVFDLDVLHGQSGNRRTYAGLNMDPASANYVVRRLYDAYPATVLATARDLRETPSAAGDPAPGQYQMTSLPTVFAVHTGMITYPIASFVRLVWRTPSLWMRRRYRNKAWEYLHAVREAVAVHDPEWRENERGEGFLVWLKGSPQQWDGSEQPINQTLGWGQTVAELAAVTGKEEYRHRTRAMSRMFRAQLAVDAGDAATWHYWPTFGNIYNGYAKTGSPDTDISVYNPNLSNPARQIEDVSHAAISVEFAERAFRHRLGMSGQDLARLARTYTQNVAEGASTHVRVDGTGNLNPTYALQAPRWMPLASWDRQVYDHALAVYANYQPTPESLGGVFGWLLGNVAYLHLHA